MSCLALMAAAAPLLAGQEPVRIKNPGLFPPGGNASVANLQRLSVSTPVTLMSIEGARQGKFPGSAMISGGDKIPFLAFDYDVWSPRDVATGQARGRRQYQPIRILKEWDAVTPLLYADTRQYEEILFVVQKIEIENKRGMTMASDDLSPAR